MELERKRSIDLTVKLDGAEVKISSTVVKFVASKGKVEKIRSNGELIKEDNVKLNRVIERAKVKVAQENDMITKKVG